MNITPEIIKIKSTASTNSELKRISLEQSLHSFCTLITEEQTSGRGQAGNSWESEPSKNLTFSTIIFPENLPVRENFIISQIFSLALKESLEIYTEYISIKWPNDIYYRDKKISGMLIENEIMNNNISSSIIGIGLNVNQEHFISNAPNPISLKQITGREYDTEELLELILKIAKEKHQQLLSGNAETIRSEYLNALYRNHGYHAYRDKDGYFQACIKGIKDDGTLLVETKSGEIKHYLFKEIQFL